MRPVERQQGKSGSVTYKVRFRLGTSPKTGRPKQTSETFDTAAEAKRFAKLLDALGPVGALAQMDDETSAARAPTLDQVAADHIRLLTGVEPGTRLTYERLWKRTWGPLIGHLPANQVTRDRIAEATNTLAGGYSGKSLKNQRGLLSAVCERAVDHGHLKANPTKGLRLPRGKESDRAEMRVLTDDELSRVISHTSPHYQPLMQFLASTGCRWGEAVALTVADVDLDTGQIRIRRALKWSPDNRRVIGVTKTTRSNRSVPAPDQLRAVLTALVAGKGRGDLVFTAPRGGPVSHRTFWSDIWFPALAKSNLGEPRPRIHDLRHSYAGRLLAAGVPIHIVSRLLGHESVKTTWDVYGGLLPDALTQAVSAAGLAYVPVSSERPAITARTDDI